MENEKLLEMFEDYMRQDFDKLAECTIKNNLRYVRLFLEDVDCFAFDVTQSMITKYLNNLCKANGEEMNIDSKSQHQSAIKKFFIYLYTSDEPAFMAYKYTPVNNMLVPKKNPVEGLKAINASAAAKLKKNPRKEGLTKLEAKMLIQTAYQETVNRCRDGKEFKIMLAKRNYAMVVMMFEVGLRISDMISLKKDNIDFDEGTLNFIIKKTKTPHKLALSNKLLEILNDYLKARECMGNESVKDCEFLFCTSTGKQMMRSDANDFLNSLKRKSGIDQSKPVSPHILRHTCGALLYKETKDIAFVKEVLGHSSVTTTQRYVYSKDIIQDMGEKTASVIENLIRL